MKKEITTTFTISSSGDTIKVSDTSESEEWPIKIRMHVPGYDSLVVAISQKEAADLMMALQFFIDKYPLKTK